MKLLLTSQGLCNQKIRKALFSLVGKSPDDIRILAVSLKMTYTKRREHVRYIKGEFSRSGVCNYTITHLEHKYSYTDLKDFDVIYMCGGNTFYYLDIIRKRGFDKLIKRFVKSGKVYLGASAGAALACPTIEYVSWSKYVHDDNDIGIKNLKGLNFVDYLIMPHCNSKVATEIHLWRRRSKYNIIALTDSQAAIFKDSNKYSRIN